MSHTVGRFVSVDARIGPSSGAPAETGGFWEHLFTPSPALTGGLPRFVILHFGAMTFPSAGSRLEVDLGYGTDRFDASSGTDAWTRPINPVSGPIRVRYHGSGTSGGVTLVEYGSGEPTQTGTPGDAYGSLTNVDPFLNTNPYVEPTYETRLRCGVFDWQHAGCAPAGSVEAGAAQAVGCLIMAHRHGSALVLSTCSGTLIGTNQFLTAAHCVTEADELDIRSGSVVFGYQTTCAGARPGGYSPGIFKVTRAIRRGSADWAILEIDVPAAGTGLTPAPLRSSSVLAGEQAIAIHHPHGAAKKLQRRNLVSATVAPVQDFDFAGGSSGSALFDAMGRVVGAALSAGPIGGDPCRASYVPTTTMLSELTNAPAPPTPFDVMLVIDRSGSMGAQGAFPGRTKMQEARDAASLFVRLVRRGAGHRLGMVSFSTTATRPPESALGAADAAKAAELVGPSPYTTGRIGSLAPTAMTSIGDGLSVAIDALATAGTNQRAVLLLTDGLQNTPPMIASVEAGLGAAKLNAIGFGAESNLDSALLSRVARNHGGLYTRANDGLELRKFFALAFGSIFEAGALADPALELSAEEDESRESTFDVCEEEEITAIAGWDDPSQDLVLFLRTPGGAELTAGTPGVETDRGDTWQFLRVPLPIGGEREGTWSWWVRRVAAGGEFPPPRSAVRLFVTIVPSGGPRIDVLAFPRHVYTGDAVNPLVQLRYANGTAPHAQVHVEIEAPDAAIGQIVSDAGLAAPEIADDPLSSFHATLAKLGDDAGFVLQTRQEEAELFDDGEHDDGAIERDGIFGNRLAELTRYEGTYRFHATARYGTSCVGMREAQWALHVALGIDADQTGIDLGGVEDRPDGTRVGTLVVTPRDRFGSPLGPGRADQLDVSGGPGTTTEPPVDNGDGTYGVGVTWDPRTVDEPSLVVSQPDRAPVSIAPLDPRAGWRARCPWWIYLLLAILVVALLVALVVIIILIT